MNAKSPIVTYQLYRLNISVIRNVLVMRHIDRRLINENMVQEFGQELFKLIETAEYSKFLLSFANVEFYSPSALGKIITADQKTKASDKKLKLCGIRPEIMEVFAITKLDQLFDIHDDEAVALARF